MKFEWETIKQNGDGTYNDGVARAKVFGGWIINSFISHVSGSMAESMVFVPDPNHEWEIE